MNFKPITQINLPPFNMGHITNYFISRVTCDGKSANDYKNLNSKAFPLFKDGHVQNITAYMSSSLVFFQAKCLPEMKKTEIYTIELSQNKESGDIVSAQCGCAAGHGPKGSCKHIAALCYALEEYNRIKTIPQYASCTSKLQEWNRPRKRTLDPQEVDEIKFIKYEHGKDKRETTKAVYDPRPENLQSTSKDEVKRFCDVLLSFGTPCGFLHVIPTPEASATVLSSVMSLPLSPRSVRERIWACSKSMEHPLSMTQIHSLGEIFVDFITPNNEEAEKIQKATARQFSCKRWHEERHCRITRVIKV